MIISYFLSGHPHRISFLYSQKEISMLEIHEISSEVSEGQRAGMQFRIGCITLYMAHDFISGIPPAPKSKEA